MTEAQRLKAITSARSGMRPFLGACPGKGLNTRFIRRKLAGGSRIDHPSVIQYIGEIGDFEAHPRILLDKQDGNSFAAHLGDNSKYFAHHQWCQALRWLIEHQKLGIDQECARNREHFLFTARELAASIHFPFGQPREQFVNPRDRPSAAALDRDAEILVDRQIREDAPALRHIAHPHGGDLKW